MSEFSRNLAVVIGINQYKSGISPLATAVNDAKKLNEILRLKHGYQVWISLDEVATLQNITRLLEETLPQKVTEDDRLLFYFAGHGIALNGEEGAQGYLIPQDAQLGDTNSYLPMTQLQSALSDLPCRHFLGLLDCCFAGAFRWSSTRDIGVVPEVIHQERYDRFITDPAWQVITSAASDQKAADAFSFQTERGQKGNHSPFAAALIDALAGKADAYPPATNGQPPGDGVITATELYLYLRDAVEPASEGSRQRQTPGIWPLKKHDKGEYIFLSPGHPLNLPPAPTLDASKNPYRGLESFDEKHSELFFGRSELVEKLQEFVKTHPLTVVLGASGSGKSSLVKAGLIPQLRQETNEHWSILPPIRPGETPLQALNNALKNAQLPEVAVQNPQQKLAQSIDVWAKDNPNSKLLLFIDQSEEIITLCQDENERKEFFQEILTAIDAHRDKLRVVLSLRSDFEPQVRDAGFKFIPKGYSVKNTELKNRWQRGRFIVPAMTRGELRDAIEKPAEARVMYFQPHDLVEQLIDEVADMPGALPLLSFALSELYLKYLKRQREAENVGETIDRALTQEDYQELGGVIQSLTQRADEEYDRLVKEDKAYEQVIHHLMLRMVAIGGGELARRRVPLSELQYPAEKNALVKEVIERFTTARLLVTGEDAEGQPYVEPAHDALVRGWQKLLMWKQEEEENLLLQRRLTPAAEEWNRVKNKNKERPKGILDKTGSVLDWLDRRLWFPIENKLNKIPAQFARLLRRSQNQQELSRAKPIDFLWNADPYLAVLDKELNSDDNWLNQVEAEFVQQSVLQKRQNISWRWRIATAVILGLSGLTITALIGQRNALIGQVRTSRQSAEANLQSGQELDALLASLRAAKTLKTEWILQLLKPKAELQKDVTGTLRTMVYTTREINQWKGKETDNNSRIAFDSQGNLILAKRRQNGNVTNVTLDNLSNNSQSLLELGGHEAGINRGITFSKDGKLATTNAMDNIRLWNLKGEIIKEFSEKFSESEDVSDLILLLSPDSKQLAIFEYAVVGALTRNNPMIKSLKLLDISGGKLKQIKPFQDFNYSNSSFGFNANNDFVIRQYDDKKGVSVLYNFKTGKQLGELSKDFELYQGARNFLSKFVLSSNGEKLANPKVDGVISLWNLEGKLLFELKAHQGEINQIAFTPNGNQLVSTGTDNLVRLWDLREKQLVEVEIKPGQIDRIEFSKNKEYKINEQTIDIFSRFIEVKDKSGDLVFKTPLIEINPSRKFIHSLSPDGMLLASAYRGKSDSEDSISLWNSSGKRMQLLKFNSNYLSSIQEIDFSADGKLLVVKKEDGTVKLWKIDGLDELMIKGCKWVRDYLQNNPNVVESDRRLCDGIPSPAPAKIEDETGLARQRQPE